MQVSVCDRIFQTSCSPSPLPLHNVSHFNVRLSLQCSLFSGQHLLHKTWCVLPCDLLKKKIMLYQTLTIRKPCEVIENKDAGGISVQRSPEGDKAGSFSGLHWAGVLPFLGGSAFSHLFLLLVCRGNSRWVCFLAHEWNNFVVIFNHVSAVERHELLDCCFFEGSVVTKLPNCVFTVSSSVDTQILILFSLKFLIFQLLSTPPHHFMCQIRRVTHMTH